MCAEPSIFQCNSIGVADQHACPFWPFDGMRMALPLANVLNEIPPTRVCFFVFQLLKWPIQMPQCVTAGLFFVSELCIFFPFLSFQCNCATYFANLEMFIVLLTEKFISKTNFFCTCVDVFL